MYCQHLTLVCSMISRIACLVYMRRYQVIFHTTLPCHLLVLSVSLNGTISISKSSLEIFPTMDVIVEFRDLSYFCLTLLTESGHLLIFIALNLLGIISEYLSTKVLCTFYEVGTKFPFPTLYLNIQQSTERCSLYMSIC